MYEENAILKTIMDAPIKCIFYNVLDTFAFDKPSPSNIRNLLNRPSQILRQLLTCTLSRCLKDQYIHLGNRNTTTDWAPSGLDPAKRGVVSPDVDIFNNVRLCEVTSLGNMTTKSYLSRQDAVQFLREKLGIEETFITANLDMLSKIQRHLLSEIPFQNITLISSPPEKRFPIVEDAVSSGLSLHGGSCIHNNWFTYLLLKALGYDVFPVGATFCGEKEMEDMHMLLVVRNLIDPEDPACKAPLFLVDAASGYPLPSPIPLHRLPITYPETAGLEVRMAKIGDYIYRLQHDNDPQPNEAHPMIDGWKVIIKFDLTPRDPPSFRKGMEASFCADPPGSFMRSPRLFRWPLRKEWAVGLKGNELVFYGKECPEPECIFNEKTRKHKMLVKDRDLDKTITKYFPMICKKQLEVFLQKIEELKQ